jgi:hydrogenase maturation protein HypF
MACAWLACIEDGHPELPPRLRGTVPERSWHQVGELARTGLASPLTSSMGRLLDAVAALCGICPYGSYEGQAAIEFEAACGSEQAGRYSIECVEAGDEILIDPREAISQVVRDLARGNAVGTIASRFHAAVSDATARACALAAAIGETDLVVLSGGVFQNRRLLESTLRSLVQAGLRALTPELLPANDGGISFGQAAIAAGRIADGGA